MKTTNQFIESQQELARKEIFDQWPYTAEFNKELMYPWIDTLITQIIQNTGEELLRLAEGEKMEYTPFISNEHPTNEDVDSHNQALETLKQHIASITEVE